jgi:hypothetical protein
MKYRIIVEKLNRKNYGPPAGWDSLEQVAADLQCDPAKVTTVLADAIRDGAVQSRKFQIWDKSTQLKVTKLFFRIPPAKSPPTSEEVRAQILKTAERKKTSNASTVLKYIPVRFRALVNTASIALVLADKNRTEPTK